MLPNSIIVVGGVLTDTIICESPEGGNQFAELLGLFQSVLCPILGVFEWILSLLTVGVPVA
ncbi:hypothetical protein ACOJIV_24095 [Haloarcula sp. AONF1]